ncbi:unnamed protein product [Callosobruchus maculatus]|uniref:Uncharacterized protein n=1 Tax=Callosobruchus maculatus TaxID=64391 RepID=A0A653CNP5_CALMS|nr:unnamed protein product [Callosobruchus maculatus]
MEEMSLHEKAFGVEDAAGADSSGTGATVGISGYSSLAPSSHLNCGQQPGKGAVLLDPENTNKT